MDFEKDVQELLHRYGIEAIKGHAEVSRRHCACNDCFCCYCLNWLKERGLCI
jgi:hypothetical protein